MSAIYGDNFEILTHLYCSVLATVSSTDLFTIDPTTGEIRTGQPLTGLSRPNSYLVNVTAEADGPPRINSTIVAIRIYDQKAGNYKPFFIRPDEDGKQFPFDKVRIGLMCLGS